MSRNSLNQFNLSFMKSTKNYEVVAVLTTQDENGKQLKKKEPILVIGAISCADAEYRVMTEKENLGNCDCTIVSSKESNLSLIKTPSNDSISESYYKVTTLYAVSASGDKIKYERENRLILCEGVLEAIRDTPTTDEVICVSKSRIVEVIYVGNE